jgi:hypothetical protein
MINSLIKDDYEYASKINRDEKVVPKTVTISNKLTVDNER